MQHRKQRLASLIREELGPLIVREFEFPNALVTLTEVELDDKLLHADVYVTAYPETKLDGALRTLNAEARRLERVLLKKLRMRVFPRLRFERDRGPEHAARVEKLLMDEDNK